MNTPTSAETYLRHLTGEPEYRDDLGRAHYPPCPVCRSTRFHRADCDASERFGAEARELFWQNRP